nr:hypothetical protein [Tanacetum cinerariifolium]
MSNDSVSCDDSDKYSEVNSNDFASSDSSSSVSTSGNEAEIESNVGTPIKEPIIVQDLLSFSCNSSDKNEHSSRTSCNKNGYFNKKAGHFRKNASFVSKLCFVCGSGTHLIKDCDFYEKQMANKTVGIEVGPVHSKNKVTHQHQFVPQAILLRTGKIHIPPARPQPVPIGLPLKVWTHNTFAKVASKWGDLVEWEDLAKNLFFKRLCVKTKLNEIIVERFTVIVKGSVYWVHAKEMEAWDLFICNDSYESESSDDEEKAKEDGSQSGDKVTAYNDVERVFESSCMHNNVLLYDNNHNNIMTDKDKVLSEDPFNLFDILNKRKDSGDDLKYPPVLHQVSPLRNQLSLVIEIRLDFSR